jgi:hypothetical protein
MDTAAELVAVGDTVACDGQSWLRGVVVERVCAEYVRVLWDDLGYALTHRNTSLRRIAAPAALRH